MRSALVIPSWAPEDIFSSKTASSQINYWQPLGTLYVAAVLQKAGHEVKFFNGAFMPHEEILAEIEQFNPAFIGIYSTTFGWKKAKETAADLREMFQQKAFICAGGPYPVAVQEECLEDGGKSFDAVVYGEGEFASLEILERLESGKTLEGVQGVIYRDGERIIINPERPLIDDLDSLPFPARDLLGDSNQYIPLRRRIEENLLLS